MKHRGLGRVYQRGDIWWIQFSHRGEKQRESSNSTVRREAEALLKERLGEAGIGKLADAKARRTTLKDLMDLVLKDYEKNGYDTPRRQREAFAWLLAFFSPECKAEDITGKRIAAYEDWRKLQPHRRYGKKIGCSPATLNRELAALRHAFNLAKQQGAVADVPYIQLARENNQRKGFFERHEFKRVREHLPEYLKAPMTVSYLTGWRVASELLTRERKHIIDGMLTLDFGESKNDEPRRFPLDVLPELRDTINRQQEVTRKLEIEQGRVIPLLFHHNGKPIRKYDRAWKAACAKAGVERIPHDFRRTAARALINAGVDPFTTCQLVGWKSMAMLKRYNIVNDSNLKAGVEKLRKHLEEQTSNVVSLTAQQ